MKKIGENKAIPNILKDIKAKRISKAIRQINKLHPADIADIINYLEVETVIRIIKRVDGKKLGEGFMEINEKMQEEIIDNLSDDYIVNNIICKIQIDEAGDIINELPKKRKKSILEKINSISNLKEIICFLDYPKHIAASVMTKDLIKVNNKLNLFNCYRQVRQQSSKVKKITSIYVVDDDNKLLGILQVKKILGIDAKETIENFYKKDIYYCQEHDDLENVADMMQRYDLNEIPVINKQGELIGCIEINEVLDFVKDEAEKDYQLASGLSEDVESMDKVSKIVRARVPWQLIGLIGGLLSAKILGLFDIENFLELAFFTPLIAAMGGNVGTQSSAIIVQWIASNPSKKNNMIRTLLKELRIGLINASICSMFFFLFSFIFGYSYDISIAVSLSLFSIIIFASLFGVIFPLVLNNLKINPAIATGTFITITNDIIGLLIYFVLCNMILF